MSDTSKATRTKKERGNYKSKSAAGVVNVGEVFTQQALIERLGITRSGLNEMKKRGLKTRADGGRVKITGKDYLEYVESLPVIQPGTRSAVA